MFDVANGPRTTTEQCERPQTDTKLTGSPEPMHSITHFLSIASPFDAIFVHTLCWLMG